MEYPKAPRISQNRAFECPCCCQVLGKTIGKDRKRWRKHLAHDVYPYTCPILGCTSDTIFFIKRKDWKVHLQEYHQTASYWLCSVCGEDTIFTNRNKFEQHIKSQHVKTVDVKSISAMSELSVRKAVKLPGSCPVCNFQRDWSELESFIDHLADCIHGFSIAALPWNDSSGAAPTILDRELQDTVNTWLSEVEDNDTTKRSARTAQLRCFSIQDIDLTSKDASDRPMPNNEYFNENDKLSRVSDVSANADVASTRRSVDEQLFENDPMESHVDSSLYYLRGKAIFSPMVAFSIRAWVSRSRAARRGQRDERTKAGRIWAREVDDPWWPCILALDGGGIRGYSTLLILKALMDEIVDWEFHLRKEDPDPALHDDAFKDSQQISESDVLPCHYFDFMYGSSSGGLIATLLGRLRMTVREALDFWLEFGDAAFARKRSVIPLATKYHHKPLEKLMKDTVRRKCKQHSACDGEDPHPWNPAGRTEKLEDRFYSRVDLGNQDPQDSSFNVDSPRVCHSCCLTATHDERIAEAYLLRTYNLDYDDNTPNWLTRYNEGADLIPIWQVVRATLAAPFFFEPVTANVRGEERLFKDAGIRENNPSGAAISEFHSLYHGTTETPAVLLSIGAGRPENIGDGFGYPSGPVGRLPFVGKFLEKRAVVQNLLIKYTEGEKQHQMMRAMARGEHGWYKRLNVDKNLGNLPMDDWVRGEWHSRIVPGGATLTKMEQATEQYLDRSFDPEFDTYAPPRTLLRQTAEKLVRQRRAREQQGGERWKTFAGKHLESRPHDLSQESPGL